MQMKAPDNGYKEGENQSVASQPQGSFGFSDVSATGAMAPQTLPVTGPLGVQVSGRTTASWELGPAKQPHPDFLSGLGDMWREGIHSLRVATPASIINNGSRINFLLRATADVASMLSGGLYNSPYRLIASGISLTGLGLGLVYKEKPNTEERQKRLENMPVGEYITMRIKDAFDPKNHIIATVGMATIPNGIFMALSGYKQRVPGKVAWEMYQGLMTVAAGLSLNFIPNQERAWQVATGIFIVRAPFAGIQAQTALKQGFPADHVTAPRPFDMHPEDWKAPPGDRLQWVKFILNQSCNVFGFIYGGIHKDEEGNIVSLKDFHAHKNSKAETDTAQPGKQVEQIQAQRLEGPTALQVAH